MFEFIKKLFPKSKKTPSKNSNRPAALHKSHPIQPAHKPECYCKKEDKATERVSNDVSCEVKNTEKIIPYTETKSVSVSSEVAAEATVEIKEETENEEKQASAYVIKLAGKGIYNFELVSSEGKTIVKSGDYTLKRSCVSGIQSVRKNGATDNIEDRTVEKPVKMPNPKYEITVDENAKYYFSLKAPNGYVILTSTAYNSRRSCLKTIENVKINSQTDSIQDMTK